MTESPFDTRLYRTPYLVLPKLAIVDMPLEWQERLEGLLLEMEAAGIETPDYYVFRNVTRGNPEGIRGVKCVNEDRHDQRDFYRLTGGFQDDPWADYRRGNAFALSGKSA
jgi:hypothetical protein